MYEPTYREPNNIIFIRDELESSGSGLDSTESGPIFVRAMEELNPGKLRQKTMPPGLENNESEEKIFNVSNTDKSWFKKLRFKKESWYKKDCFNKQNFST